MAKSITRATPFFIACLLAGGAAAAAEYAVKAADGFDPGAVKRVACLPFVRVERHKGAARSYCPLAEESFTPCTIEKAAEAELTRAVAQVLPRAGDSIQWVPQQEINQASDKLKEQGRANLDLLGERQKEIAKEVGADAALLGFVYCYRERSGNAFASKTPASIGFCLHLVDAKSGEVLWSFRYEDEQEALSENILALPRFIKRGGRWITISAMADEAAARLAAVLPWKKKKQGEQKSGQQSGPSKGL